MLWDSTRMQDTRLGVIECKSNLGYYVIPKTYLMSHWWNIPYLRKYWEFSFQMLKVWCPSMKLGTCASSVTGCLLLRLEIKLFLLISCLYCRVIWRNTLKVYTCRMNLSNVDSVKESSRTKTHFRIILVWVTANIEDIS